MYPGEREHAPGSGFGAVVCRLQFDLWDQDEIDTKICRGYRDSRFAVLRCGRGDAVERVRRDAGAFECGADRRLDVGRRCAPPAADAGGDHGFVQIHCVTGIAACQPVFSPIGPAREIAMRISLPPNAAWRVKSSASLPSVTALATRRPAGRSARVAASSM